MGFDLHSLVVISYLSCVIAGILIRRLNEVLCFNVQVYVTFCVCY